jgi:hypothetical protein
MNDQSNRYAKKIIRWLTKEISKEHTKLKQSWIKQDKAMERPTTKEYERVDKAQRWCEREEAKLERASVIQPKLEREEAEKRCAQSRSSQRPQSRHQQSQSSRPKTPQTIIDAIQQSKLKERRAVAASRPCACSGCLREVATAVAADGAVATAVAARATADYELVQQQRIESIIAGPLNLSVDPQFKNDLLAAYAQDDQSDESIPAASAVDDQSDESNSATAVYKQSIKDVEDGHKLFKSSERKMDESEVLLNESLWDLQSMSP